MGRLTKEALLGASDLREKEVELKTIGGSVIVQGLPAAFSNQASSEALVLKTVGSDQIATVDTAVLEEIQVLHGLKDPKLNTREEARQFMERCGPAAKTLVAAIDELSGIDKEAIADANARFQGSGANANGSDLGDAAPTGADGPDVHVRAGGSAGEDGPGDADRQTGNVGA